MINRACHETSLRGEPARVQSAMQTRTYCTHICIRADHNPGESCLINRITAIIRKRGKNCRENSLPNAHTCANVHHARVIKGTSHWHALAPPTNAAYYTCYVLMHPWPRRTIFGRDFMPRVCVCVCITQSECAATKRHEKAASGEIRVVRTFVRAVTLGIRIIAATCGRVYFAHRSRQMNARAWVMRARENLW